MDYSKKLNFDSETSRRILKSIAEIEKFQGYWGGIQVANLGYLKELRHIATIQSIGSSTRIEGSELSDLEVTELIQSRTISQLESRDEQEVIGYWETLQTLLENAQEIELSERFVLQLHGMLLKYSSKDQSQRGSYKNLSNRVVAKYPDGSEKTIFKTTEPHLVKIEMDQILEWTHSEFNRGDFHPLVLIALFIYEFLSIHPFHDGNGRLSRILTTLLLFKQGYGFVQYVSFEHVIEERKTDYYHTLMECQSKRNTGEELIGPFVVFFLECLQSLSNKLQNKMSRIIANNTYLSQRQEQILAIINGRSKTKMNDLMSVIDASHSALKRDIAHLAENNLIEKQGSGKGTYYLPKSSE